MVAGVVPGSAAPPAGAGDTGPGPDAVQRAAERTLLRDTIVGVVVGMVLGAGVWALLVLIALAGTDWDLGPALGMGAGVGMFAGAFYGGWAGTVVGCRELEEAEARTAGRAHD